MANSEKSNSVRCRHWVGRPTTLVHRTLAGKAWQNSRLLGDLEICVLHLRGIEDHRNVCIQTCQNWKSKRSCVLVLDVKSKTILLQEWNSSTNQKWRQRYNNRSLLRIFLSLGLASCLARQPLEWHCTFVFVCVWLCLCVSDFDKHFGPKTCRNLIAGLSFVFSQNPVIEVVSSCARTFTFWQQQVFAEFLFGVYFVESRKQTSESLISGMRNLHVVSVSWLNVWMVTSGSLVAIPIVANDKFGVGADEVGECNSLA